MLNIGVMFRNNEKLVKPFFFFLREATTIPIRVFALNQASTDKTEAEIISCSNDNDILINVSDNLGCAGGRNKILNTVTEKEGINTDIVFLDSDCFIIQHESIDTMYNTNSPFVYGRTLSFYDKRVGRDGLCFCLVRGEVFNKIGYFDDRFQLFYDDTMFAEKAITAGIQPVTCEESLAVHLWGQTIWRGSEAYRRESCYKHDMELYNELK